MISMPCTALPWALKFNGDPGARAKLAAEAAMTWAIVAAYRGSDEL